MTLWSKVVVGTGAIAVSIVVIVAAVDRRQRRDEATTFVAGALRDRLDAVEQARCEAAPAFWALRENLVPLPLAGRGDVPFVAPGPWPGQPASRGGDSAPLPPAPPSPFQVVAFDAHLRAARPGVPALDGDLARRLARPGDVAVVGSRWSDTVEVVVASPRPDGPCAYVAALGPVDAIVGSALPRARVWLLPGVAAAGAALFALASVLRKLRRMGEQVASAALEAKPERRGDELADLERALADAGRGARARLAATEQRESALRDSLANAAHDVIIPLTALQAHLATLQEHEHADRSNDRLTLTSAMAEAQYLGSLLHNLAAAAQLDGRGREPLVEVVDLNALVHRVVSRQRTIARRLQIAIEFSVPDEPVFVVGDVTLLEQAAGNVAYNAVRYNRPGGHVAAILEVIVPPVGDERFSLRVVDDGPGVPADELSRIVERGYRGRAASVQSTGGRGLGLDIACRIARLHRFELRFAPSEPGGLQVELEGPCATRSVS